MNEFNVGDIITGIPRSDEVYCVTNSRTIMCVVGFVNEDRIEVMVIGHTDRENHPTDMGSYRVYPEYFMLYRDDIHACPWL